MTLAAFESKVVTPGALAAAAAELARPLVMTNGVFDILHRGHVTYLAQARALGSSLVVAVNSDSSVRLLNKGPDRPINPESDRAAVIAALASVDLVVVFADAVPLSIIEAVRPDIYIKGGDYDMSRIPETALVRRLGGRAIALPIEHDRSTTQLLQRVRQAHF